jgi:hypothetical protein
MLFLLRSDPLVPEFPPSMLDVLEVVDSLAKSPKCVCTGNEQELEASARNNANQMLQFGKLECSVSSGPTVVRGTIGSSEGALLPAK